jgi:hypothetical protein
MDLDFLDFSLARCVCGKEEVCVGSMRSNSSHFEKFNLFLLFSTAPVQACNEHLRKEGRCGGRNRRLGED